jgi:prepilin-type processing-associated H-X9-DG protein
MRHRMRRGFSRWEILALCAVTGIVGALLVPVVGQTVGRPSDASYARAESCTRNLKQVALGFRQYLNDFDERYPIVAVTPSSTIGTAPYGWADALQPYIRNTQVYQCPSERHQGQDSALASGYTDYWYNANFVGRTVSQIQAPVLNLLAGDGDGGLLASNARYSIKTLPKSWISTANSPVRRHMNEGCYAFADGHVERLEAWEVGGKAATFLPR